MVKKISLVLTVLVIAGLSLYFSKKAYDEVKSSGVMDNLLAELNEKPKEDDETKSENVDVNIKADPKQFKISNLDVLSKYVDIYAGEDRVVFDEAKLLLNGLFPNGALLAIVPETVIVNGSYISFELKDDNGKSLGVFDFKFKGDSPEDAEDMLVTVTNLNILESKLPVGVFNASACYSKISDVLKNILGKSIVCMIKEDTVEVNNGIVTFDVIESESKALIRKIRIVI